MIYDFFIFLFVLVYAPKLLAHRNKRFSSLKDRFGFYPPFGKEKNIWIHAVSVGEVKAAEPLLNLLKEKIPRATVLVTVTTVTGFDEAKKSLPNADLIRFFPLDFSWIMRRWIRRFSPELLIFIEGDVWPNLMREAKRKGVKTALVSAKMSTRSAKRLRYLPFLANTLYGNLDVLCVQNEEYRRRFATLVKRPIAISGNLKLDRKTESLDRAKTKALYLDQDELAITIACTHAPEEKELLRELVRLWNGYPRLVFFLAPRHPERFEEAASILKELNIPFCRWEERREKQRVVLVDAMGRLKECYAISFAAIVGGSFSSDVGGHNVLEPLSYGCPVLFGPKMHKQEELAQIAIQSGAGKQVTLESLVDVLLQMLISNEPFGKKALQAVENERGSALKTFQEIQLQIKEGVE